ncbi:MAG TPA: sigma-70 family RNA polymerase sigma factor [Acidimicrobiales bacterium]|nr:sigma-70 family RNA polymerase sigma factor [Acidimicrobiales bacterium]
MRNDFATASDASLVLLVARWHESALAELYRRHAGAVFGLARRLLNDAVLAEEVVQEVFLRLWRQPERYDPERGSLRSFLLSASHSRAIDTLRSEGARRDRENRDALRTAEAGYDLEREVADLTLAEHVRSALRSLPENEQRPIALAYFAGHTYREVAELLGEPEGTVKGRIRAGLRRMHDALAGSGMVAGGWPE